MAINFSSGDIQATSKALFLKLRGCYQVMLLIDSQLAEPRYDHVVRVPRMYLSLDQMVADIQSSPNTAEILEGLSSYLPGQVVLQDVVDFYNALGNLSGAIEANANVLIPSFDPTEKNLIFVTPLATGVHSALQNFVTGVLATVE
jgi:hypothetical protein